MSTPKRCKESELVRNLVFEINRISIAMRKNPVVITKNEFLEATANRFTEWELRKVGGYNAIINTYFRYEDKDLTSIQAHRNHLAYVHKLEQQVGNMQSFREKMVHDLAGLLAEHRPVVNPLNRAETRSYIREVRTEKAQAERSVVALWSDQHFGTNVCRAEMGGKNAFNWRIGARRLGKLCEQIATYKIEKRQQHQELVILLLGDNIGGIIHNQEGPDYELLVHQLNGASLYYMQALEYLKGFFERIRVVCQPGNHGRVGHKISKDRALNQKFDSHETTMALGLSMGFAKDPQVSFEISKAPFADVLIQNHRVYATHGDTVFLTGNVGSNIRVAKIEEQVNKINAEELRMGRRPYELVAVGHVHHPLVTELPSGVRIAINGCLIGSDAYALGIGLHSSNPSQIIWESTDRYVQGDVRIISVVDADDQDRYEKIVRPYDGAIRAASEFLKAA